MFNSAEINAISNGNPQEKTYLLGNLHCAIIKFGCDHHTYNITKTTI